MCLKPQPLEPVPEETARIARRAYSKGNIYLQLRDTFGTIYQDEHFAELYPQRGQPAQVPWRLALVCVMQFREGLSDRQAADAMCGRLDWKYLLGLELSDPGFDHSVLVEFRQRLLASEKQLLIIDLFLLYHRVTIFHGYKKCTSMPSRPSLRFRSVYLPDSVCIVLPRVFTLNGYKKFHGTSAFAWLS